MAEVQQEQQENKQEPQQENKQEQQMQQSQGLTKLEVEKIIDLKLGEFLNKFNAGNSEAGNKEAEKKEVKEEKLKYDW